MIDGDYTEEYEYWNCLKTVRDKSLAAGIPYWDWLWSSSEFHQGRRAPSESDLRYTVYKPLAFGYTRIQYLTYDTIGPPDAPDGIIARSTGGPSYLYQLAQDLNFEIANLGPVLTHIISTSVFHAGPDNPSPGTAEDFTSYGDMIGFNPNGSNWTIGFFEDSRAEEYFMVVNNEHHQDATAAECTKSCVITFDASITSLQQIDRLTGDVITVNPAGNYTLSLTLPGGTGELFKYDTGWPFINYHCGDYGYETSDLSRNCLNDLPDMASIAEVWLTCTYADPAYCDNFMDCDQMPVLCKWLEKNWRLNNYKDK